MEEKEKYIQIIKKYKDKRLKLTDTPTIGKKLVYMPNYADMIYTLHDHAYHRYKFEPGDAVTVKELFQQHPEDRFQCVLVKENACVFTPAHFVPVEDVASLDVKALKEIFAARKTFVEMDWRNRGETP